MNTIEFKEWNKIARYSRDIVITEKIDGTNGIIYVSEDGIDLIAGSRTRWLDEHNDNFGFRKWVMENKKELLRLGPGYHYGEWWGKGIQRNYGLEEKRFSLFNVHRWTEETKPKCCFVVPTLWTGLFDSLDINMILEELELHGSKAVKGFMKPEGIVIYHTASKQLYKKTIEGDDKPKSLK